MIPSWKLAGVALLAVVVGSAASAQTNDVPQPSPLHSGPSTKTLPRFGTSSADQPAKKQHARHGRGGAGSTPHGATTPSGN